MEDRTESSATAWLPHHGRGHKVGPFDQERKGGGTAAQHSTTTFDEPRIDTLLDTGKI